MDIVVIGPTIGFASWLLYFFVHFDYGWSLGGIRVLHLV